MTSREELDDLLTREGVTPQSEGGLGCLLFAFLILIASWLFALYQASHNPQGFAP
jgi:hypothetical protein